MTVCTGRLISTITEHVIMSEDKTFNPQASIEIIENGPIKIVGNILISDYKRDIMDSPEEVFLCRCGKSENKPYCDGSHKRK